MSLKTSVLVFTALAGGVLAAAELLVTPENLTPGERSPEVIKDVWGETLKFKAAGKEAASARLPGTFDFSKGAKIEFEFSPDQVQSNSFPRLFDSNPISVHMDASGAVHMVKLLLNGKKGAYKQAVFPIPANKKGAWYQVAVVIDPAQGGASMTFDGKSEAIRLPEGIKLSGLRFMLGSTSLGKSDRGFNGMIRNLRITTPFSSTTPLDLPKMVAVTKGVRHVTVAAMNGRHFAFPGVAKLPDGTLAAVFREGQAHVCPYGRICIVYSKDGGANWSAPIAISDTASDERDPSIQTLADGRVLVTHGGWNSWMAYQDTKNQFPGASAYIKAVGEKNFGGCRYLFSDDGGMTFSAPIKVPAFAPHGPVVFPDGSFGQPSLGNDNGKRQVYFWHGSADAKDWKRIGLVGESSRDRGDGSYEEPHTAILADGTLVTAIRVPPPGDGYMRISRSSDGGKTWSEPVKTPVRGFPQHLLPLKDGRLLATYGYRYEPMGVRACVSKDGGLTWDMDNEIIIRNNGRNGDIGYPVAIELDNGEVFCVYYFTDTEHDNCFLEGAFFRP